MRRFGHHGIVLRCGVRRGLLGLLAGGLRRVRTVCLLHVDRLLVDRLRLLVRILRPPHDRLRPRREIEPEHALPERLCFALAEPRPQRRLRLLGQVPEVAERRHVSQAAQVEELEKAHRGAVQQRSPRLLLLPDDLDQLALEQRLEHRAAVDATHVVDLRPRDRLAVGHDRQRLDLRATEPGRLRLQHLLHPHRVLRVGPKLKAARDLGQHHAALRRHRHQVLEGQLDLVLRCLG